MDTDSAPDGLPAVLTGDELPSLSAVMPSALAALGLREESNVLALDAASCIVVLLVDGLGWQGLRRHAAHAPFLSGLAARPLVAGFPTTTAVSITSLGTGVAAGQHGIVGYTTRIDDLPEPASWLSWRGASSGSDLTEDYPPTRVQPVETVFERAARAGLNATVVSAASFRNSGLTRAALRGGDYVPAFTAADTATLVADIARSRGGLIYCYIADLDLIGHVRGSQSPAWSAQLQLIDRSAQLLYERLPPGARLLVTADHGMLDIQDDDKIDYDDSPELHAGVALIAGEARARYLYVEPGELSAVRARWSAALGSRATVLDRDDVISRGWFGPQVSSAARDRIGDLVVVATSAVSIVRRRSESRSAALIGHHGARSDAELLVPLLSG